MDKTALVVVVYIVLVVTGLIASIIIPYYYPKTGNFFVTERIEDAPNYDINIHDIK